VAAVGVGSVIGLGCWLVGNQSAADAAPIKVQQRVEGGESEQRRRRAVCCAGVNKVCYRTEPRWCWLMLAALGGNPRVTARKLSHSPKKMKINSETHCSSFSNVLKCLLKCFLPDWKIDVRKDLRLIHERLKTGSLTQPCSQLCAPKEGNVVHSGPTGGACPSSGGAVVLKVGRRGKCRKTFIDNFTRSKYTDIKLSHE